MLPSELKERVLGLSVSERLEMMRSIIESLENDPRLISLGDIEEIRQQKPAFQALLQKLGETSPDRIASILAEREIVQPEEELTPEIITRLQQRIRDASRS